MNIKFNFELVSVTRKILSLLDKNEKKSFLILIFLITISGLFEMLGVASIVPIINILFKNGYVENVQILRSIYLQFNFKSFTDFKIILCIFFIWVISYEK